VVHANGGVLKIEAIEKEARRGLEVCAFDDGPGIENLELALQDGWTSGGGLGVGLNGAKRLMDEFEIQSEVGKGTKVQVVKWMRN
jgi:serine/threonine-protein kinase RsbT